MRIAYLNGGRIPSKDANSVAIAKMCEALALIGHDVTLFAREGDAPADSIPEWFQVAPVFKAIIFPPLGFRGTRVATLLVRLALKVRRLKPDLCYGRDALSLAAVAHLGRPLVFEAHNIPRAGSLRWKLLEWLMARRNFLRLVCITDSLRRLYLAQFPTLVHDSVIVAASGATEIGLVEPSPSWPGRDQAFQVGFVGRPYRGKGIETIVAAAASLEDVDLHIVGAQKGDVAWLEAALPSNIHFHGYRTQPELGAYYARFDAVVAPYGARVTDASGTESTNVLSSLKIMEYMSSGIPLVASNIPGVSEVLTDGDTALLIPPGDVAAFVAAIERLRSEPDLGRRLATRARDRCLESYTWAARARLVLDGLII